MRISFEGEGVKDENFTEVFNLYLNSCGKRTSTSFIHNPITEHGDASSRCDKAKAHAVDQHLEACALAGPIPLNFFKDVRNRQHKPVRPISM